MGIIQTTSSNFEADVLRKQNIVLVDFYADWCGPCKMTEPVLKELSSDPRFKDITFVKVDVDSDNELASKYNVLSIPTFMLFRNGKVISQFVGARDRSFFENAIKSSL